MMQSLHLKELLVDLWSLFLFALPLLFCAMLVRNGF